MIYMHTYVHTYAPTYDIIYVPSFIHPPAFQKVQSGNTAVWHSAGVGVDVFFF